LSGIDVATQALNQTHQDPWLAIVIDPVRTISAGKVEIGAFRTYPENYKPANAVRSEWQSIPSSKIEDFGVHLDRYYPLATSIFKSSTDTTVLDLLWNKYWTHTLSSSPLVSNREYTNSQINDVVDKMERAENDLASKSMGSGISRPSATSDKKEETALDKAGKDAVKVTSEALHGLFGQVLKDSLFNTTAR
jgi:COP9 signalosome complex subunit 5